MNMKKKSILLTILLTSLALMSACGTVFTGKTTNPQERTNVSIDSSQDNIQGDTQRGTLVEALKDALFNRAENYDKQTFNGEASNDLPGNDQSTNSHDINDIQTPVSNAKVTYTIPDEFIENGENTGLYYNSDYPTDTSNINVIHLEKDTDSLALEADTYKQLVEDVYLTQYKSDVDIDISTFKKFTLDGYDALLIKTSYNFGGVDLVQQQITVQIGESTTTITCTQAGDHDWEEIFAGVIDSVHVEE